MKLDANGYPYEGYKHILVVFNATNSSVTFTDSRLQGQPLYLHPVQQRSDAADMLKRRLKQAGLPAHYSPHSFRATGITNFLENDGILEAAQRIAVHADSRTTKLYDRRGQKVLLEDMERIRY